MDGLGVREPPCLLILFINQGGCGRRKQAYIIASNIDTKIVKIESERSYLYYAFYFESDSSNISPVRVKILIMTQ